MFIALALESVVAATVLSVAGTSVLLSWAPDWLRCGAAAGTAAVLCSEMLTGLFDAANRLSPTPPGPVPTLARTLLVSAATTLTLTALPYLP